jgi:hypothetical protein
MRSSRWGGCTLKEPAATATGACVVTRPAAASDDQIFDVNRSQKLKRTAAREDVGDVVVSALSVDHRLNDVSV